MWLIQKEVHDVAVEKGWWEGAEENIVPEKLMLIVSEVAEALEEYRKNKMEMYYNGDKPEGFGVELADAIIRILDLSQWLGLDMEDLVTAKHTYNKSRSWRHGGKLA